jgi:hypothetical protein
MPFDWEATSADGMKGWPSLWKRGAFIIAFRGAGNVNGIEPTAEQQAVAFIRDYVIDLREGGSPVVLMYDGDGDVRARPDIGTVFGQLADALQKDRGVIAIAAQMEGWYGPPSKEAPIANANGIAYETYVFSDSLPGLHSNLTQSRELVAYPRYEQIFVGPIGQIGFGQLKDVNDKVSQADAAAGKVVKVTVISTPNNPDMTAVLDEQRRAAAGDAEKLKKIDAKIAQREGHPFGFLCARDGEFNVECKE